MKVRQLSRLHLIKQINLCKRRMLFSFSTKNVSFFSPNRPRVRSFLKIQTAMSCPHVPHTFIFIFQLANPMKLHKFSFLLLCHVVRVLWPGVKIWDQVCSHRQLAAPPTRLPAVVLTENCSRQRMKKHGFPGPKARTVGFALPDWPREKGMAQSAGQGHWSDEKIIQHPHPHPPPSSWTSCSVKPFVSSDRARLGRKDMSGKLQNLLIFLWMWKDLYNTFSFDGLSHVQSRQPFLLTRSNNESVMCMVPFSLLLMSSVSSCQVGMLCRPLHRLSQAYGEPLTCWLPGTRVSSSPSHRTTVCFCRWGFY